MITPREKSPVYNPNRDVVQQRAWTECIVPFGVYLLLLTIKILFTQLFRLSQTQTYCSHKLTLKAEQHK